MPKVKIESVSAPKDTPYTVADQLLQKTWEKILASKVPWTPYEQDFIRDNSNVKRRADMTPGQWNFLQDLILKANRHLV